MARRKIRNADMREGGTPEGGLSQLHSVLPNGCDIQQLDVTRGPPVWGANQSGCVQLTWAARLAGQNRMCTLCRFAAQ
jgi:hypothetical protein